MEQTPEIIASTKEFSTRLSSLVDEYIPKVPVEMLARIMAQSQLDLIFCYSDARLSQFSKGLGEKVAEAVKNARAS